MRNQLETKLKEAFSPERIAVSDESHLHAGHAGVHDRKETHFRVHIVSTAFEGKSRIERHRMVNEILAEELKDRVHALAVRASAPDEEA